MEQPVGGELDQSLGGELEESRSEEPKSGGGESEIVSQKLLEGSPPLL